MVDRIRHSGIFNCGNIGATMIGLGGIGSMTALTLAKMGVRFIHGVDPEIVGEENIGTQMYQSSDVGSYKAKEMMIAIGSYAPDVSFYPYVERVNEFTPWRDLANEIVISGVDSIESRQNIWSAIWDKPWKWYIDARMGAENVLIYTVKSNDRLWYRDMILLQNDEDAIEEPCTSKATFFCATGIACVIGKMVRQIVTGQIPPKVFSWNIIEDNLYVVKHS